MNRFEFPNTKLTLIGKSWAADQTALAVPELSLFLDAGAIVHEKRASHVFVTHTHTDHAHMLTHMVSRRKPPVFHVPRASAPFVTDFLKAAQGMTDNRPMSEVGVEDTWIDNHTIHPVVAGDTFDFTEGGRKLTVEVVHCEHSVPCVGYGVSERKSRLKDQYKGMQGKDIGKLKKDGVEVTEQVLEPLFLFMGDTSGSVFRSQPHLMRYPVIITECTFLHEEHRANAERTKHTMWSDLEPIVREHPSTTFVLIHFSHRHRPHEICEFFEELALANVVPFTSREEATSYSSHH